MTELQSVEIAVSPHLPKTFVRVYKDNVQRKLIITLADEKDCLFRLPNDSFPISDETDTGEPEPRDENCLISNSSQTKTTEVLN